MVKDKPRRGKQARQGDAEDELVSTVVVMDKGRIIKPATMTIGGVSIQEIVADLKVRLDAIRSLVERPITAVDLEARVAVPEERLAGVWSLADVTRAGAKKSGEIRANKDWHKAARKLDDDNPALTPAQLVRKIEKDVGPDVEHRTVQRFVKKLKER